MLSVWTKLRRALTTFAVARGGNVALTFAMATLPIIGGVGAAVDFSRANSIKTAMQAALDSTALMLAKEAGTDTASQLHANAAAYFKALFNRADAPNPTITVSYTTSGGSAVVVNGSVSMPTNFLGVIGYNSLTINTSSTTKWGSTRLRVALVLDNTGSMASSGKMSALKTATNNLLTQLKNAASTNGDVYVSIIPFVKDVNLGAANYTSSWIDWTTWDATNGTCTNYRNYNGRGGPSNKSTCQAYSGTWTSDNHSTWNGCVVDRGNATGPDPANYDTNVGAPAVGITASLYAAEQYSACPQTVMPLSYDWSAMTSLVNNMSPNGNTNQAIGLQVGWMSLAGGGPFSVPATDSNYQYQQIVILLTDGLNTQDRWYSNQSSIDARQQLTCSNIKAAGITVYTIQVNTDGDPTSTLLQDCASSSDKFYLLTSASQIVTTFQTIGTNLTQLRVAQ
jgi:Flp pilus assembly protein TadG